MSDYSLNDILQKLGMERNKYNYLKKSLQKSTEPKPEKKSERLQKPIPDEVEAVEEYEKTNPGYGYKRYAYMLLDANIVDLKEYQEYEVLKNAQLLLFAKSQSAVLKHPPYPGKPDEICYIYIMYL